MDLDNIEIQTVEVLTAPDGKQICRIHYVTKPLDQQDPAVRARVQFVERPHQVQSPQPTPEVPVQNPAPMPQTPPSAPQHAPRTLQGTKPKPGNPNSLTTPITQAWRNASNGAKALILGSAAAILLQSLFLIIRLGSN